MHQIPRGYIWLCIVLQPIIAFMAVTYMYMQRTGKPFNTHAAAYYYSIASTCSSGGMLFAELVLILGSLGLFRLSLTFETNAVLFILANICLAAGLIGPGYMVFSGMIPYCWK